MTIRLTESRILVIFSIIFIAVGGYGMILPVLPYFAENMGASPTDLGFLFAVYPLMQFLFSPVWGRFSDRLGRRPIILSGMAGIALSFLLCGLAQTLCTLFLARILGGILSSATLPTSFAYIADVSSPKERGTRISWLSASTGLGIFVGPMFGGFLGEISFNLPFFGAAAFALFITIAGIFLLPESLHVENRTIVKYSPWLVFGDMLFSSFRFLKSPFGFMLLITFLMNFASANLESTFGLMVKESLGFGAKEVGLAFTIAGIVLVITQGLLVGPLIDRFGESSLILIGLLSSAIGYGLLPYSRSLSDLLWIFAIMSVFNAAMRPSITTWLSKKASPLEQGLVLGQSNSYMSIGRVVGPVTGGLLFHEVGYAAPYLFAASVFILTSLMSFIVFQNRIQYRHAHL